MALPEVSSGHVAALRAFLAGDEAFGPLSRQLAERDGDAGGDAYAALMGAVLTVAARRRFAAGYTTADLVRLVTRARAALAGHDADMDPGTAERTLRAVLGDPTAAGGLDDHARADAVAVLLLELTHQENLHGAELDALLAEARPLANLVLAERA